MADDNLFLKIVRGEIDADVVYRDELVTAFRDIDPQAPVHVLIVPNEAIESVAEAEARHEAALGRLVTAARRIAEQEGLGHRGYRLIVNCGPDGGQEVPHLHLHLLGGEPLGPMRSRRRAR
jgi:histidine triad (HIT) family protein